MKIQDAIDAGKNTGAPLTQAEIDALESLDCIEDDGMVSQEELSKAPNTKAFRDSFQLPTNVGVGRDPAAFTHRMQAKADAIRATGPLGEALAIPVDGLNLAGPLLDANTLVNNTLQRAADAVGSKVEEAKANGEGVVEPFLNPANYTFAG